MGINRLIRHSPLAECAIDRIELVERSGKTLRVDENSLSCEKFGERTRLNLSFHLSISREPTFTAYYPRV